MWTTENTELFPQLDLNEGLELQSNVGESEFGLNDCKISSIGHVLDCSVETWTRIDHRVDEEGSVNGEERGDTNVNSFMKDFLLDSIAVQFHTPVFWNQFFAHIFFPASYFLLNYKAQGFAIGNDFIVSPNFYFNILFPSIIYLMIVTYFLCPPEDELAIRGAFWVPTIFFIQHRMTIALKYASLSPSEYAKFQCLENNDTAARYMHQMQLLSGWAMRDSTLLQFELGCAGARIGAKINEISIMIANPNVSECARKEYACWNALLRRETTVKLQKRPARELVRHADGSYTMSIYDVSKAIIRKADASSAQKFRWVLFPFLALMILLPWLSLLSTARGVSGRSVYMYVFLICSLLSFATYGMLGFMLLYVSVWDVSRQLHMVRYLHRLIRITDLTLDSSLTFHKSQRRKSASKRGSNAFSDDIQSSRTGKEAAQQRNSEHLQEKVGIILSVIKSEKEKSIALRESLRGHFSAQTTSTRRSDALHTNHSNPEGISVDQYASLDLLGASFPRNSGSSPRGGKNTGPESVSARDIKSRFHEFGSRSLKDEDDSHIPQLSFKLPENIVGWTYARLVFQHFGERFRNRVDTYTGEQLFHVWFFFL